MTRRRSPHFDLGRWTDYLRGLRGRLAEERMKAHLKSGCESCRQAVSGLLAVLRDAQGEVEPPDHAVRGALALFSIARPRDSRRFRRVASEIGYDSLRHPAPCGVRQLASVDRRLVLNAGRFVVDTRLDRGEDEAELSVVGQLLTRGGFPVPDVPAFLASGEEILSCDSTSTLGEFQMSCPPRRRLRLTLSVGGPDLIELSLALDSPFGDDTQVDN